MVFKFFFKDDFILENIKVKSFLISLENGATLMRKFRKKIYNLFVPEFFGLIFKFIIIFKNYFL